MESSTQTRAAESAVDAATAAPAAEANSTPEPEYAPMSASDGLVARLRV